MRNHSVDFFERQFRRQVAERDLALTRSGGSRWSTCAGACSTSGAGSGT